MIKFLFEDRYDTPSGILLRNSYNGDNILFAGGGNSSNMFKSIENCIDNNTKVIVFFDLPPNNEKVYKNYEALLDKLLESDYTEVYIIPIICIEYYILKFLVENKYLVIDDKNVEIVNNLIFSFDYSNEKVQRFINYSDYRKSSLEHVYKDLLKFLVSRSKCMLNSTQYNSNGDIVEDSFHGVFYKSNCTCDRKFCRSNCYASLKEKAERLYTELPIFDTLDDMHISFLDSLDIKVRDKDFKRLFDEIELLFDEICKSMCIPKPLIMRYN